MEMRADGRDSKNGKQTKDAERDKRKFTRRCESIFAAHHEKEKSLFVEITADGRS